MDGHFVDLLAKVLHYRVFPYNKGSTDSVCLHDRRKGLVI